VTVNNFASLSSTTLTIGGEGGANGIINSAESIYLNIDSNNNETGKVFRIGTNDTGTGGDAIAQFSDNGDISFYEDTGTTPKFVWDSSAESLGIGIVPSKKLTVFGSGAGNATVQIEGESGADPYINFLANNTQHWSLGVDDSDSDKFKLSEHSALGTNDYFVVDVSGNVGIGGTPTSLLDVKGSTGNSVITLNSAPAIDAYPSIGKLRFYSNDNSTNSSGEVGSVEVIGIGTWNGAINNAAMTFNLIQGLAGTTSPVEAMRIDSNGNLLAGTSNTTWQSQEGLRYFNGSSLILTRDSDEPLNVNRLSNNGALVNFYKDGGTPVGSIGSEGGDSVYFQGGTTGGAGLLFHGGAEKILPVQNSASIDATIDLGQDSRRFKDLYLSGGAYLGGTAAANKLDDYEEGTWTPVLDDGAGNTTSWAGGVEGYYTKVGNMVTAWFKFSSSSTAVTNRTYTRVTGLPFANSGGEFSSLASLTRVFGWTIGDENFYVGVGGTTIVFRQLGSGNAEANFTPTGTQQRLSGGATYRTS
jgi:hypothetical protein